MKTIISLEDKKAFINWILENKKMKRRDCTWMLDHLLTHDKALERVRFMEEAHYAPRSIVLSTTEVENIPFRFYSGNLMTADADKANQELRMYPEKEMCIQINFSGSQTCVEYMAVLEENEYIPDSLRKESVKVLEDVSEDTERLVSAITASTHRVSLMNEIDKALDSGDKELFMQLSRMLNEHEETKEVSFSEIIYGRQ